MPDNQTFTSATRRRTASAQLLRKAGFDPGLLREERDSAQKSRKLTRWTACFAFVTRFKKSRNKPDVLEPERETTRRHSSSVVQQQAPSRPASAACPYSQYLEGVLQGEDQKSTVSTVFQWKENQPLPVTPMSALSPPPRYITKERSHSLTIDDVTLPPPTPRQPSRQHPTALRLSMDVEQHYNDSLRHSSSLISSASSLDERTTSSSASTDLTMIAAPPPLLPTVSPSILINRGSRPLSLGTDITTASPSSSTTAATAHQRLTPEPVEVPPSSHNHGDIPLEEHPSPKTMSLKERRERARPRQIPDIDKLILALDLSTPPRTTTERRNIHGECDNDDEDDDGSYQDLLDEFQFPSEWVPASPKSKVHTMTAPHQETNSNKEATERVSVEPFDSRSATTSEEFARQVLENKRYIVEGSKSMDIVRDKAHYDAVVASTMHRRPWTHHCRAQSAALLNKKNCQESEGRKVNNDMILLPLAGAHRRPSLVFFPPSPNSIS